MDGFETNLYDCVEKKWSANENEIVQRVEGLIMNLTIYTYIYIYILK